MERMRGKGSWSCGLKKEHREWIRDFGAFLGQGDRETMGRSIELSMKQMDLDDQAAERRTGRKKKDRQLAGRNERAVPDHSAVVEQGRGYEYQSDF